MNFLRIVIDEYCGVYTVFYVNMIDVTDPTDFLRGFDTTDVTKTNHFVSNRKFATIGFA